MPLLTLKEFARELGYKSVQTVYNMEKKRLIQFTRLPNAGGKKRLKGPPRVDASYVDKIKSAGATAESQPASSTAAAVTAAARRPSSRRAKPSRPKLVHFE